MTVNYDGQKIVISTKLAGAQIPLAIGICLTPFFVFIPYLAGVSAEAFPFFIVVIWEVLAVFNIVRFWAGYIFHLTLDSTGIHRSCFLPQIGKTDILWADLYGWGVHAEYPKTAMNNSYHEPRKSLFFKGQSRKEKDGSVKTVTSEIKIDAAGAVRQDYRIISDFVSRYSTVGPDGISL